MRVLLPLLLASALVPTSVALPPAIEVFGGDMSVRVERFTQTLCADEGPAHVAFERETEAGTIVVAIENECAPAFAFRATLDDDGGWSYDDPTLTLTGVFRPTSDPDVWWLEANIAGCPPGFICEFPTGAHAEGLVARESAD